MPKKILLIDDDSPIRELYFQILTGAGYSVDQATDGKEGLEALKNDKYDLVLMDIMMPQIDGIGELHVLEKEKIVHPPILLMTNLLNDPAIKEATELGVDAVVTKVNLPPDQFLNLIQQKLGDQLATKQ